MNASCQNSKTMNRYSSYIKVPYGADVTGPSPFTREQFSTADKGEVKAGVSIHELAQTTRRVGRAIREDQRTLRGVLPDGATLDEKYASVVSMMHGIEWCRGLAGSADVCAAADRKPNDGLVAKPHFSVGASVAMATFKKVLSGDRSSQKSAE